MFSFGKALVLLILFLALLGKGIKFPFTILLRQFFLRIISLLCFMPILTELLKVGSVVQCPCPPVVVNPLSVSIQPNGKKRLILDLTFLLRNPRSSLRMPSPFWRVWQPLLAHGLVRLILSRAIIVLRYLNLNNFWVSHGCLMVSQKISSIQFYRLDSLWDHIFFQKL